MAQQPKLFVAIGATGNQGNAILRYFAKTPGLASYKLRGLTRNVESSSSKELQALGVEMVKADLDDESSLTAALQGATHIFATTDSNRHIFEAIQNPEILPKGEDARSYARKIELGHGRNIAKAAAATKHTLQRLIWSGLTSPARWSKGKYTKVTVYDAKEEIGDILKATPGLEDKLSTLIIGYYATNALNMPALFAPQKLADGTYELSFPVSGKKEVPFADVDVDAGAWVNALFQAPAGTTLIGSSEFLTWRQWLEMWAQEVGVRASYRQASHDEWAAKMPSITEAVVEAFEFSEEFGFDGGNPAAMTPDQLRSTGIDFPPASRGIRKQIGSSDWSSIL